MAVTLRDVARHAGVSVRTVSNVVNGFEHVSNDMRSRVQEAVRELDYRPNLLARSLRQGRTGVVALVMPELREQYFGEIAHAIIEQARQLGWTVLIDETDGRADHEEAVIDIVSRSKMVDGAILSLLGLSTRRVLAMNLGVPVVLLGERTSPQFDHVTIDNAAAARAAVQHLLDQGRRRIAAIGLASGSAAATARVRLRGYEQALRAAGLDVEPGLTRQVHRYHLEDGAAAMRELLDLPQPPDAVFAFNDTMALGAMRAIAERGLRVGHDVLVLGFDDIAAAAYSVPSLSSVAPDKDAIARTAVELLHARIGDTTRGPQRREAGFELRIRESTRPVA